MILEGYAATFHTLDRVSDVILPKAFTGPGSKLYGLPVLVRHDQSKRIGTIRKAVEDERGLFITAEMGREGLPNWLGIGVGLSIGYVTRRAHRIREGKRLLLSVRLFEVSVTTDPINPEAVITRLAA